MRVKMKDIRPDLRVISAIVKLVVPPFTEESFKKSNRRKAKSKGKWRGRNTCVEEKQIEREDGSRLRVLVCRPKTGQPLSLFMMKRLSM